MRIVLISNWFSENVGYAENFLPRALADKGHEVHLVTSTAQIYFRSKKYKTIYEPYLGPHIVEPCEKKIDSFSLHRFELLELKRKFYDPLGLSGLTIKNLYNRLKILNPDVIQVFNVWDYSSFVAAKYCLDTGIKFFTESHIHSSVLRTSNRKGWREIFPPLLNNFRPSIKLINNQTILCYPISIDSAEICKSVFKVPQEKIKIQSLGVDTNLFSPIASGLQNRNREVIRANLGIPNNNIVIIYTGRFSIDKSPHVLADAIDILHDRGYKNFSGLFVGTGTVEEISYLKRKKGCIVHPFVLVNELPDFYRAVDIGVWPREESTSQLDAVACGLPIIISDKVSVTERVEGNGLFYKEGNSRDLADKILALSDAKTRRDFSLNGVKKVQQEYSWEAIANSRLSDYLSK